MMWALYGGFVAVVATGAYFALKYGKKHRLGVYENAAPKKVGKHALTAEITVVDNETAKGYADYKTADIPKITDEPTTVVPAVEAPVRTTLLPPVPLAVRTDTTMMEAVDPTKYPEWLQS